MKVLQGKISIEKAKRALRESGLVLYRAQDLSIGQISVFAQGLGEMLAGPESVPGSHSSEGRFERIAVEMNSAACRPASSFWHNESSFCEDYPDLVLIYCHSAKGAYIEFADTQLSGGSVVRSSSVDMRVTHSVEPYIEVLEQNGNTYIASLLRSRLGSERSSAEHTLVVKSKVTGRECRFVNELFSRNAWEEEGGMNMCGVGANIYTHRWQSGDLIVFDNAQYLHRSRPLQAGGGKDISKVGLRVFDGF